MVRIAGTVCLLMLFAGLLFADDLMKLDDQGGVTRFMVDPNGKVGIGTSAPYEKLEISSGNAMFRMTESVGTADAIFFNVGSGANADANQVASIRAVVQQADPSPLKGRLEFRTNRGDNAALSAYFDEDGHNVQGSNSLYWWQVSDEREKKNVDTMKNSLDTILRLRGVTFEWLEPSKHNNVTGTQMGLIAQEVEQVVPQWVYTANDGSKLLCPDGYIPMSIEAFKELNTKVKTLEAKNADLEARLKAIEEKLK